MYTNKFKRLPVAMSESNSASGLQAPAIHWYYSTRTSPVKTILTGVAEALKCSNYFPLPPKKKSLYATANFAASVPISYYCMDSDSEVSGSGPCGLFKLVESWIRPCFGRLVMATASGVGRSSVHFKTSPSPHWQHPTKVGS